MTLAPPAYLRFWVKAVNCCVDVRALLNAGPDGGACPPGGGPCRGFDGECALLPVQFAAVPVLPDYPDGLADYSCAAFPDDDSPFDSFIVGLIALAVAIPVTLFLKGAFEFANDSEAPDAFLQWSGLPALVCGLTAHRRWHYTRAAPPARFVRWQARCGDEPKGETLVNLFHSLRAWLINTPTPWVEEARRAEAEAAERDADAARACHGADADDAADGSDAGSSSGAPESLRSARALARRKWGATAAGVVGTYAVWAIFAWFIFVSCMRSSSHLPSYVLTCAVRTPRRRTACSSTSCWASRRSSHSRAPGASATA